MLIQYPLHANSVSVVGSEYQYVMTTIPVASDCDAVKSGQCRYEEFCVGCLHRVNY